MRRWAYPIVLLIHKWKSTSIFFFCDTGVLFLVNSRFVCLWFDVKIDIDCIMLTKALKDKKPEILHERLAPIVHFNALYFCLLFKATN